jgi:hypothetical protein
VRGIKRRVQRIEEISDRGIIPTGHLQPPYRENKSHRFGLPEPVCFRPNRAMTPRASEQDVTLRVALISLSPTVTQWIGRSGELP